MEDSSNHQSSSGGPKRRKMGRPVKLTDEERKANLRAKRDREKAKRRLVAAKKKEERMELARTDAVKYYSLSAQGSIEKGFVIAATRPSHHSFIPFGYLYPLHSNQMTTIQQQQMMISAQMATAARTQAQFTMQASAAAAAATAAKVAHNATGGVARTTSHSVLPLLLAGMPHGGHYMTVVHSGLQKSRAESARRDNDLDSESRGNSSGKEDTPPNDRGVPTAAPCKRKREEKNDEDENETADDPSSAFKQRVGRDFHPDKGTFGDGADDTVGPFADDDDNNAGLGDNTDGISNDAAIPFAHNAIDNANDNVEENPRPNVLLLGMSYPDISCLFGSNADPSPRDVADAVQNGQITQIDARDLVRARALEKFADVRAYCVSLENAATYDEDRHLRANFNDVSTKTKSFLTRLQSAWPGKKFQEIILDYFWSPSSWVSDHWKSSFFSTVLPAFVTKGVLEEGGTVYLPSCLHCVCEITAAIQCLSKVYRISFLHKSDLEKHKLWAACNSIESDVKDDFLRWFGHAMGEEEKYCKLSIQGLGKYMCPDSKVRMGDVKQILNQIKRLEGVRMVALSALTASEKENRSGGFDFS